MSNNHYAVKELNDSL